MEIPKITLSATDIKDIGKKIAKLKASTDIDAFIIDTHQPFHLQDRSDGGHDEFICVMPQHGARGAGERRASQDIEWLTYVVGCAIGNIDPTCLEDLDDIEFKQSDETPLDSFSKADIPKLKVSNIPDSGDSFNFNNDSPISYRLKADVIPENPARGSFEFNLLRMDVRYVLVVDYVGGY